MMAKVRWMFGEEGKTVIFSCPGCNHEHVLNIDPSKVDKNKDGSTKKRPCWTFNGNMQAPTFTPSVLYKSGKYAGDDKWYNSLTAEHKAFVDKHSHICHTFVTDGMIRFLGDCTHSMKNQTVALPEVEPLIH